MPKRKNFYLHTPATIIKATKYLYELGGFGQIFEVMVIILCQLREPRHLQLAHLPLSQSHQLYYQKKPIQKNH